MRYQFSYTATVSGTIEVEADNEEDALYDADAEIAESLSDFSSDPDMKIVDVSLDLDKAAA